MRVFRVVTGVLAGLLGLLGAVAGGVAVFGLIGPGDVLTAGTHRLTTRGVAIATSPDLIRYYDARLVVTAEPMRRGQQVFVGIGNHVDVRSYLAGSAGAQVVEFGVPSTMRTRPVAGSADRLVPPDRLGWWVAEQSGPGARTLSWRLADGPYDVVVMNADGRPGVDVRVTAGVEFPGAFRFAVVVFAVGLALLVLAAVLLLWGRRPGPRRRRREDDDELLWEGREAWEENEYWAGRPAAERSTDERPSWLDSSETQPGDDAEAPPPGEVPAGEVPPDRAPDKAPDKAPDRAPDRAPVGQPPTSTAAPRRTRPGWDSSGNSATSGPASPALPWRPAGARRPSAPPGSPNPSAPSRPDRLYDGRPGRPDTSRPDSQNEHSPDLRDRHHWPDTGDSHDLRDRSDTGDGDEQRQ
ncbi:hypothetical protein ACWDWO_03425 [Actinopolymorpha singaporensis]|uniref:Uncharacterized protein n=1 Tax=Actinopolymorpha singaporensis TaxID=117157 RepID=A0A1H1YFM0_9ACTN|nr:hypothetical protein [Actinopolymorpha singaporensis]SDT20318.1 hypothetical protein SAMN04489717_5471 [Actinopolymorpha singaporensis]